jgi:hypothetical protein
MVLAQFLISVREVILVFLDGYTRFQDFIVVDYGNRFVLFVGKSDVTGLI